MTSQAREDWVNINTNVSMDTMKAGGMVEADINPGSLDEILTLLTFRRNCT
jgi:hypothetical protein